MYTQGILVTALDVSFAFSGASSNDVLPELLEELAISNTQALQKVQGAASSLPTKSYRWVAEMQEIGAYYAAAGVPEGEELFEGMAKLFGRTDMEKEGDTGAGEVLRKAAKIATEKGKTKVQ